MSSARAPTERGAAPLATISADALLRTARPSNDVARSSPPAQPDRARLDPGMPIGALTVRQLLEFVREYSNETPSPTEAPIMNVEQVARMCDLSTSSIWRLVRSGQLRSHVLGGARRFLRDEVLDAVRKAAP
jgi:excisionase family DNA binding protein